MTTLSLALDGLIIAMLAVAIGYGMLLNGRLRRLRDSRGELEQAVHGLDGSISKAQGGLAALQQAAEGVGRDLDQRIEPGKALAGELAFIAERAETAAARLEQAIARSRVAIAAEESQDKEDARRFAQALRPLSDDDHIGGFDPAPRAARPRAPQGAEPRRAESRRAEPKRPEARQAAPKQAEPKRSEPGRSELGRAELGRAELIRAELMRAEAVRAQAKRAEPSRADFPRERAGRDALAGRPIDDEMPRSRGAALVRALRGMR